MKKITNRAVSVLLLAVLIILGMLLYVIRYADEGEDWAMAYSRANAGSSGAILDRNGLVLASFNATENAFSPDETTRIANYHITGDYWGRSSTGLLTRYDAMLKGYSPLTGVTVPKDTVLRLNVDAELNNKAYAVLNGRKGAVLVCNYRTGELLCMVSSPAVDPADPDPAPGDGAYINRCLSASFVPGSVFKLITAAAAIECIPELERMSFTCEGSYNVAGVEIVCSGTHGEQTFEQALSNSCNVAFSQLSIRLGQSTMLRYVRAYGFLDGHELDGIPTATGSFPEEFVGDPELGWAGIGQSTDLMCPYSLLRFVCAVANDGVLLEPSLINTGRSPTGTRFMKADTAERLREMMNYNVVHHYDGANRFPGLALCAKTGTAERGDGTSNAWFAGFLLDEEHPYAFVVLIEQGGGGLQAAGGAANEILQYAVGR